ncbi:hypothetical protein [Clostridium massiliamazoniense]|uniref:hypothetical protein n=1 Tax=Clostridium massiliamazoniense TaxID=1347366 RepID=UPI0006D7A518|nr:hypothetical protein [Clostridium massiliamazoniense]
MAELSSFFNAIKEENGTYDRVYDASDWAEYFASFIGNGVFANPANSLQVQAGTGLSVIVNSGKAWINGYYYNNIEPLTLTLAASNTSYSRIDRVVCELNLNTRNIKTYILTGTFSANPVAPAIENGNNVYQLSLAEIKIMPNAINISQSSILDTRANNEVCGFVAGVIDQIDTTGLFNQFTSAFDNWFASVKADYSNADLTKLLSEINSIKNNSGNYLTASSSPTISGQWTFSNNVNMTNNNGQITFENNAGNGIELGTNGNTFFMANMNTGNDLIGMVPSNTSGSIGSVNIYGDVSMSNPVTVSDYLEFALNSSTNPTAGIEINSSKEFIIYNNNTNNSILGFTPVTSGTDTLNIYGNLDIQSNVTMNDEVTIDGELLVNDNIEFALNSSTNPTVGMEINGSNEFVIYNTNTNNNLLGFTPVTSGEDTLNIYGNVVTGYIKSNNIDVVDTISTTAIDINECLRVKGQNFMNTAVNQSGTSYTTSGEPIQYVVNGWYCSPYLLTETTATDCGFFGVIGVNLTNENGITVTEDITIDLNGSPFANAHLRTAMGVNVPFIQVQATTTPFYISKINDSSITISMDSSSEYLTETYVRLIITN